MQHYLDLQLRPDPEFPAHQLMAALYGKLHRALVQLERDGVRRLAVAFPGYASRGDVHSLGTVLRLVGPTSELAALQALPWLQGMSDHVSLSSVQPVPASAEPGRLLRVQAKSGIERERRRAMRRLGLTEQQARERMPDSASERLELPHLSLRSASTGQRFLLFLRLVPAPAEVTGEFNSYGLSSTATIPLF